MVIDTSALIAVLLNAADADRLVAAIERDPSRLVSGATVVEASLVLLGRYGEAGELQLDRVLKGLGAQLVAVDEEQVVIARDATLRYGRGRHAAALNFRDCFSYALAIARGEALLFTRSDFSQTDVEVSEW